MKSIFSHNYGGSFYVLLGHSQSPPFQLSRSRMQLVVLYHTIHCFKSKMEALLIFWPLILLKLERGGHKSPISFMVYQKHLFKYILLYFI